MANTTAYTVQGTTVSTLKEVAELLGNKVTKKDIEAGKYEGVYIVSTEVVAPTPEALDLLHKDAIATAEAKEEEAVALTKEAVMLIKNLEYRMGEIEGTEDGHEDWDNLEELVSAIKAEGTVTPELQERYLALTNTESDTDTVLTNTEEVDESVVDEPTADEDSASDDQLEYPEVGTFETDKAMKKYIKGLKDAELAEWCELEGVEYKANEHLSINRMRMAMAIKALHFPDTAPKAGSTKKKSKYSDYTTEQLVEMALDNDVEVRDDKGDQRILRMYTIMALKEAGLLG